MARSEYNTFNQFHASQEAINDFVESIFNKAIEQLERENPEAMSYMNHKQMIKAGAKRLRSCSAYVWETSDFYILQSYNTFIACIPKEWRKACFDALRIEYGYTATSAQHVSKFEKEYGDGKWGVDFRYTARPIYR